MPGLYYIPVVLSLLVLAAHFLRYANAIGVAAALVLIALLFVRKAWVLRLVQVGLVLGALEWARTLYVLVQERMAFGAPVARMTVIIGIVIAVTALAALLLQTGVMRRIYRVERRRTDTD